MEESAEMVLSEAGGGVIKQGIRCTAAYIQRREELFERLDEQCRLTLIDNCSYLGRKWASIIPDRPLHRLADPDVCAALHVRTLCPGSADNCRLCGLTNAPGHDEVCHSRPNWRLARHEVVKKAIIHHLGATDKCSVISEPVVEGTKMRTDFRVIGPPSIHGVSSEFDLSVASRLSMKLKQTIHDRSSINNSKVMESRAMLQGCLETVVNVKNKSYLGKTATPFHPLVMSSGGTLSPGANKIFNHWRSTVPTFEGMVKGIALLLVRASAKYFDF
jgi:hypothetical protein